MLHEEAAARDTFGDAQDLVRDDVRVDRIGRAADRGGRDAAHVRRRRVEGLPFLGLGDARPHPAGAHLLDDRRDMARRQVDHDVAVAVQAAGGVAIEVADLPVRARPRLPGERRPGRIHSDALDRAGEPEAQRVRGGRLAQADQEQVAGLRLGLEGQEASGVEGLGRPVDVLLAVRRGERGRDCDRHDRQVVERGEDDRVVSLRADRGRLGPAGDPDGVRLRTGEPEGDLATRRRRREQPDPDQLEELHVVPVRDPVDPVQELVRHPGEELDQGDAGVGDVVVRPLRATLLDEPFRVVDEILEAAIVQVGDRQGHRSLLRGDHVEREDEVARVVG